MKLDFSKPAPIREFVRNYMQHRTDVSVVPVASPAPVSALPAARPNRQRDTWLAHDVMLILLNLWPASARVETLVAYYSDVNKCEATDALNSAIRRILRRAVADGRARRIGRGTIDFPYQFTYVDHRRKA